MTSSNPLSAVFNADILFEKVIDHVVLTVFDNGLILVDIGEFTSVTEDLFGKCQQYLHTLGSSKQYHFVFRFASFADIDPDMRKKRATKEGSDFSLSDAIVISNLPQKMLGDFYMRINRPVRPTKFFFSLEKAVAWSLKEQKKASA